LPAESIERKSLFATRTQLSYATLAGPVAVVVRATLAVWPHPAAAGRPETALAAAVVVICLAFARPGVESVGIRNTSDIHHADDAPNSRPIRSVAPLGARIAITTRRSRTAGRAYRRRRAVPGSIICLAHTQRVSVPWLQRPSHVFHATVAHRPWQIGASDSTAVFYHAARDVYRAAVVDHTDRGKATPSAHVTARHALL
jgi:hypothetical protein